MSVLSFLPYSRLRSHTAKKINLIAHAKFLAVRQMHMGKQSVCLIITALNDFQSISNFKRGLSQRHFVLKLYISREISEKNHFTF